MAPPKANKPTVMLPTMGVAPNAYKMLCNVVSRKGTLERRPRLVAMDMGYSTSFSPSGTDITVGSDNLAFAPQWRVHTVTDANNVLLEAPGGVTLTSGNLSQYITTGHELHEAGLTTNPKAIASVSDSSGLANVQCTGHDLAVNEKVYIYQASTSAAGPGVGEHTHSRTLHAINPVVEGIDCEIINGKIVAIYVGKFISSTADHKRTDLHFYHSYHHPGDPRMGYVKDITAFGSTKDDRPSNWYNQASYWNKRIQGMFSDYAITGYGVGPTMVGGSTASINESDSVSVFAGFPLKMLGATTAQDTIARVDPYSSFYTLYSPKNAFAHTDRHSGQTIWYGFLDGDRYDLTGELPAELALLMAYHSDVDASRQTVITRPHHIWYSEPASPLSLSVTGWYPMFVGSQNMEIVGMADYQNGTAIFSRDAVHFMKGVGADVGNNAASRVTLHSGVGADSRWSIKSLGDGVAFANKNGLWFLDASNQVREVTGFRELFDEGVDCTRGSYHQYFGGDAQHTTITERASHLSAWSGYSYDDNPWRDYKIDKSRLDRAVAGVWDDLYLLFVSLEGDDLGDDNRLCLCWNWKENRPASMSGPWTEGPTSVWLLPKNQGVRGFAYDGSLETPYVMTRYGLSRFEKSTSNDVMWGLGTPLNTAGNAERTPDHHPASAVADDAEAGYGYVPYIITSEPTASQPFIMGQSRWLGESGDATVTANVIVQHETKNDIYQSTQVEWDWETPPATSPKYYGGTTGGAAKFDAGDDEGMRIAMWAMQSHLLQSQGVSTEGTIQAAYAAALDSASSTDGYTGEYTANKMRFTRVSIGPLENLISRDDFKGWRGRHARHSSANFGPGNRDGTVRVPKGIRRASAGRSGFASSRCAFEWLTCSPDKILSVQVIMNPVAPRGETA